MRPEAGPIAALGAAAALAFSLATDARADHAWSFAGADDRAKVGRGLLQPFVS